MFQCLSKERERERERGETERERETVLSGGGFWLRDLQYPHSVRSEDTVDPGSVARGPYVTPGLLNDRPASLRHLSVAHGRCGCRAENNNVTKRPNGGRARGRYVTPGRLINHCVAVRSGRNVCFLLPAGHARLLEPVVR